MALKKRMLKNYNLYSTFFFQKVIFFPSINKKFINKLFISVAKHFEKNLDKSFVYNKIRPARLNVSNVTFGMYASDGLLLYVYYDSAFDAYRCALNFGNKYYLYDNFSFYGVTYSIGQYFYLPSSILKAISWVREKHKKLKSWQDWRRGVFPSIYVNFDPYFYTTMLSSLTFNLTNFEWLFKNYLSYDFHYKANSLFLYYLDLFRVYYLNFSSYYNKTKNLNNKLSSINRKNLFYIKVNLNSLSIGVPYWGFWWSKLHTIGYEQSITDNINKAEYRRDYVPMHFFFDNDKFNILRMNPMVFFFIGVYW